MVGELDAPLSPLVEDASSWIESCSQQIPKTRGGKSQRSEETREFRLTGLSGGKNADKWRNANGPRNDGVERTNLSAGSAYLPHDPSESSGGKSIWFEPPRETQSRQEPWTASYLRAVTDFELYASEIGQHLDCKNGVEIEGTCLEYLDLLFTQGFGPEVGNQLMAAIRTIFSRYSRHGDLDMPRTVKALKGWTRLTPPMSRRPLPWTNGGCSFGDSVASPETSGGRGDCLRSATGGSLRPGELATLRQRNLEAEESGIRSKTHTFDDSVILDRPDLLWMDRLWHALIVGRPGHARFIPMDQNEIAREVKTIFEELGL